MRGRPKIPKRKRPPRDGDAWQPLRIRLAGRITEESDNEGWLRRRVPGWIVSAQEVADYLGVPTSTVTRARDTLVERGLLRRSGPHVSKSYLARDGSVHVMRLTPFEVVADRLLAGSETIPRTSDGDRTQSETRTGRNPRCGQDASPSLSTLDTPPTDPGAEPAGKTEPPPSGAAEGDELLKALTEAAEQLDVRGLRTERQRLHLSRELRRDGWTPDAIRWAAPDLSKGSRAPGAVFYAAMTTPNRRTRLLGDYRHEQLLQRNDDFEFDQPIDPLAELAEACQ